MGGRPAVTIAIVVLVAAVLLLILSTLGEPAEYAKKRPHWYDDDEA
jgi:hypothetical protein